MNYWCAGTGGPGVLLEGGGSSAGTDAYPAAFVDQLAAETTVCAYDRLGTGTSDTPPHHARTLPDLCDVQDQVLAQLLPAPYVLVGQSLGGGIVIGCAARHPERIAGLVSIEGYHDDPDDLRGQGFTWDDNPEDVDAVGLAEELDVLPMPIGDLPVLIVSATDADPGGQENQRHWLQLSPHAEQVAVAGPHDLQEAAPAELITQITSHLGHLWSPSAQDDATTRRAP